MMTRILFLEINLHIIGIKLTDFLSYPSLSEELHVDLLCTIKDLYAIANPKD